MSLENVTLPPGFSTGYHSHDQDIIFVITAGAIIKNQVLGKEPVELEFKLGEVRFAPYTKTPGTHQITNIEKENTMRLLAVGIVYSTPGRYTVSTRPEKYEVALDNDRVRAWRSWRIQSESFTAREIFERRAVSARQPFCFQSDA